MDEPDYERDHWQEYKDDVAQGLIYEDGSPRDCDPPDEYLDGLDAWAGPEPSGEAVGVAEMGELAAGGTDAT